MCGCLCLDALGSDDLLGPGKGSGWLVGLDAVGDH